MFLRLCLDIFKIEENDGFKGKKIVKSEVISIKG